MLDCGLDPVWAWLPEWALPSGQVSRPPEVHPLSKPNVDGFVFRPKTKRSTLPFVWQLRLGAGIDPVQTGKTGEIAVIADPLAAVFDGQSGQVGIGNQIALVSRPQAEVGEDLVVTRTGADYHAVGTLAEALEFLNRLFGGNRVFEDPRMGDDSQETGKDSQG